MQVRFRRQQEARAELHALGAEAEHRRHAGAVGDAAAGDHRDVHRLGDRAHQHQRADLVGRRMAAGLDADRDHRIDAGALRLERRARARR